METIVYILGILLTGVLFFQPPKDDSFSDSFGEIHITKMEKRLTGLTFFLATVISLILLFGF